MDEALLQTIRAARETVLARISAAAKSAGRDPAAIALTAVSKVQPDDRIEAMLAIGQRVFGENRVQEAQTRWGARRGEAGLDHPRLDHPRLGETNLHLRLIGPLQTNKVREAVELFDAIETLDRDKLARALADAMAKTGKTPELMVQVNTGEEDQKAGVAPHEADAFIARLRRDYGIEPSGLMCIPPAEEPAGLHFALLAKIAARNGLAHLSMGMSSDYETAVMFGATRVRVGSALFGERVHAA